MFMPLGRLLIALSNKSAAKKIQTFFETSSVKMGNSPSQNESVPDRHNFDLLDYGYCLVWRRKIDEIEIMEEYPLDIQTEEELNLYKKTWLVRANNPNFVKVLYFSHKNTQGVCGGFAKGQIFLERVSKRLSEYWMLPYQTSMEILRICLEGFQQLYNTFGCFIVKSTMIGVTDSSGSNIQLKYQHQLESSVSSSRNRSCDKNRRHSSNRHLHTQSSSRWSNRFSKKRICLWHHPDFSQPQPQDPNCHDTFQMLVSILNSIEQNSQQPKTYPRISEFLVENNRYMMSFNTLRMALDVFCEKYGIVLQNGRNSCELLIEDDHLRRQEGWEKFTNSSKYPKLLFSGSQVKNTKGQSKDDHLGLSKASSIVTSNRSIYEDYGLKDLMEKDGVKGPPGQQAGRLDRVNPLAETVKRTSTNWHGNDQGKEEVERINYRGQQNQGIERERVEVRSKNKQALYGASAMESSYRQKRQQQPNEIGSNYGLTMQKWKSEEKFHPEISSTYPVSKTKTNPQIVPNPIEQNHLQNQYFNLNASKPMQQTQHPRYPLEKASNRQQVPMQSPNRFDNRFRQRSSDSSFSRIEDLEIRDRINKRLSQNLPVQNINTALKRHTSPSPSPLVSSKSPSKKVNIRFTNNQGLQPHPK